MAGIVYQLHRYPILCCGVHACSHNLRYGEGRMLHRVLTCGGTAIYIGTFEVTASLTTLSDCYFYDGSNGGRSDGPQLPHPMGHFKILMLDENRWWIVGGE